MAANTGGAAAAAANSQHDSSSPDSSSLIRRPKNVSGGGQLLKKVDVVAEVDEVSAESIDLDMLDQTNQLLRQKKLKRKGDNQNNGKRQSHNSDAQVFGGNKR